MPSQVHGQQYAPPPSYFQHDGQYNYLGNTTLQSTSVSPIEPNQTGYSLPHSHSASSSYFSDSHNLGQAQSQAPWYPGSTGNTPPSDQGATPPFQRDPGAPFHPQTGHGYTPMNGGYQLITPATHDPFIPTTNSGHQQTRPPLTTSVSFPGTTLPSFDHGHFVPNQAAYGPPMIDANGYAVHAAAGPAQNYNFGLPPASTPHLFTSTNLPRPKPLQPGPSVNDYIPPEVWEANDYHSCFGRNESGFMEVSPFSHQTRPGSFPRLMPSYLLPPISTLHLPPPPQAPSAGDPRVILAPVRDPQASTGDRDKRKAPDPGGPVKTMKRARPDIKKIKQRRRTTADQLKVLEDWYDVCDKPDNAMRDHLAKELSMSTRNIQVWFQNRRAKVKAVILAGGTAADAKSTAPPKKAKSAGRRTPETRTVALPPTQPAQPFTPLSQTGAYGSNGTLGVGTPMGLPENFRRASLASGEAGRIQDWAAAQRNSSTGTTTKSTALNQASTARRGSTPYPQYVANTEAVGRRYTGPGGVSPALRPPPPPLHITAMRNNTRRSSMPGHTQLISATAFTPPRTAHYPSANGSGRTRELSSIQDAEHEFPTETNFNPTFNAPPTSAYIPSTEAPAGLGMGDLGFFAPPPAVPNPSFSFGTPSAFNYTTSEEELRRTEAIFNSLQERGRVDSIVSVNTGSEGSGTIESDFDVFGDFDPQRRASAPNGLHQDLGMLGLDAYHGMPMRPSPLGHGSGNGFTASEPSMQPPYIQTSQSNHFNNVNRLHLDIPSVPEHSASVSPAVQNQSSPIDLAAFADSLSAPASAHSSVSPVPSQNGPPSCRSFNGFQTLAQPQEPHRSSSAPAFNLSTEVNFWEEGPGFDGFDGFGDFGELSLVVPDVSVSAPASAQPESEGEQHQKNLLSPVTIPDNGSAPNTLAIQMGVS